MEGLVAEVQGDFKHTTPSSYGFMTQRPQAHGERSSVHSRRVRELLPHRRCSVFKALVSTQGGCLSYYSNKHNLLVQLHPRCIPTYDLLVKMFVTVRPHYNPTRSKQSLHPCFCEGRGHTSFNLVGSVPQNSNRLTESYQPERGVRSCLNKKEKDE